jgi:hypothetical protein
VNDARFNSWIQSFAGYRLYISRPRIQHWLNQFTALDNDLAARLLDAVEFYRHDMLETAYSTVLRKLPGWSKNARQRSGRWRFVPFTIHPGESGDRMLSVFRTATGLNTGRYDDLFVYKADLFKQNLGPKDTVVFVDDFTGTGQQAITAWKTSLAELLPGGPRTYLLLVAAVQEAMTKISTDTPLQVRASRHLGDADDLFSNGCAHFSTVEKDRVLHYCQQANPNQPKGFGDCGVLIVMAHRCPNDSLPILHSTKGAFKGLFPR